MPYSPIRLEQINLLQFSGYILDVVDGQFVLLTGDQTVEGEKTFENIFILSESINRKVINESSYSVSYSDYYLAVNTSGSAKTLSFPIPSGDAKIFKVKDIAGQSTGNAITLSGAGVTFDYQSTFVISDAYASVDVIAGSGNNYEIL
jgi:hypothetical protein